MLKAETSKTSRRRAGVAGIAITGLALPVMVGLSLTVVGPAAADVTNKQSFTAAQAQSAASNVMSFRGATTPPIGKSRSRPTLVGSAAARSDAAPKAGTVAAFAAASPQTVSAAEQVKASMAARPAAAGNEALLYPVTSAALRNNAVPASASTSGSGPTPAAAAVVPAAGHAPAGGTVRTAMLKPASTMAADRSATTALLKSKAEVNALRKARHDAAVHQR